METHNWSKYRENCQLYDRNGTSTSHPPKDVGNHCKRGVRKIVKTRGWLLDMTRILHTWTHSSSLTRLIQYQISQHFSMEGEGSQKPHFFCFACTFGIWYDVFVVGNPPLPILLGVPQIHQLLNSNLHYRLSKRTSRPLVSHWRLHWSQFSEASSFLDWTATALTTVCNQPLSDYSASDHISLSNALSFVSVCVHPYIPTR